MLPSDPRDQAPRPVEPTAPGGDEDADERPGRRVVAQDLIGLGAVHQQLAAGEHHVLRTVEAAAAGADERAEERAALPVVAEDLAAVIARDQQVAVRADREELGIVQAAAGGRDEDPLERAGLRVVAHDAVVAEAGHEQVAGGEERKARRQPKPMRPQSSSVVADSSLVSPDECAVDPTRLGWLRPSRTTPFIEHYRLPRLTPLAPP